MENEKSFEIHFYPSEDIYGPNATYNTTLRDAGKGKTLDIPSMGPEEMIQRCRMD